MTTRFIGTLLFAAAVTLSGCDDKKAQPPIKAPGTPAPTTPPSTTPAATPPASTPASTTAPAANSSGPNVSAMGVSLTLPAAWKRNPPANSMRLAEAAVPDAGGDATKACLVVFSTAGGTVEDNIARWSGQVRDAKGQPVTGTPQAKTVNGLKVSTVELSGSFAGMGDGAAKDNWMLRGAIIEAPEGLLFIKMTGPAASMTAAAKDFDALIQSLKKP